MLNDEYVRELFKTRSLIIPKDEHTVEVVAKHIKEHIKNMEKTNQDMVNSPKHYTQLKDRLGCEVIDIIEAGNFGYHIGNAIKYIFRCEHKESKKQDLQKAIWYLRRELERT